LAWLGLAVLRSTSITSCVSPKSLCHKGPTWFSIVFLLQRKMGKENVGITNRSVCFHACGHNWH